MNTIYKSIDEICQLGEAPCEGANSDAFLLKLKNNLYNVIYEASKFGDDSWIELGDDYRSLLDSEIKPILKNNFPLFGYYHVILNQLEISKNPQTGLGDAIDDLCDIIKDLSEVRWRINNVNEDDGLSYLSFTFKAHTEDHIIDFISYLNEGLSNYA